MSRIGKKNVAIPAKVEVTFTGGILTVKGPLGEIKKDIKPVVAIKIENGFVSFSPTEETLETNALWGTYASHVKNMVEGVEKPFEKKLIVEGIGFKADVKGKDLHMALGFSHPVIIPIPADLKVVSEKGIVTVSGIDLEKVGQFAANLREWKKPEPYKGKGIRYSDEVIRRKQGKKSV